MSSSLQKKTPTNRVVFELIRVVIGVLLFTGLVIGTIYCVHVVGDLHTQAETLSACMDTATQHAAFCPTDTVISTGEVDNVLNQAKTFGSIGWVCAIGAFITFFGTAWMLFD